MDPVRKEKVSHNGRPHDNRVLWRGNEPEVRLESGETKEQSAGADSGFPSRGYGHFWQMCNSCCLRASEYSACISTVQILLASSPAMDSFNATETSSIVGMN